MVEIKDTELVFSFPDVDEEASLRIHFCGLNFCEERIPIQASDSGIIRLAAAGHFFVHLRPRIVRGDHLYRCSWYPFALLVSVGGKNAITGAVATTLARNPQNYFITPPQGGIDGYYVGGRVCPFRAAAEPAASETRLEIKVFPMKRQAFAYFKRQLQLVPGPGPSALRGIRLLHGGDRQCEPIYEDICSIGDWDKDREEQAVIWASGGSQATPEADRDRHSALPSFNAATGGLGGGALSTTRPLGRGVPAMERTLVGSPEKLRIPHDDHRFKYVGRLADGRQFMAFVTGAFPDGIKLNWDTDEWRKAKQWLAVLHLFDAEGNRLSSEAKLGGYDIDGYDVAGDKARAELARMLGQVEQGEPRLGDIWVRQFAVQLDGVTHSLLYEAFKAEDDGPVVECVMLEPRDIMFHPPWDNGEYST
jgi:hypothetical protein